MGDWVWTRPTTYGMHWVNSILMIVKASAESGPSFRLIYTAYMYATAGVYIELHKDVNRTITH